MAAMCGMIQRRERLRFARESAPADRDRGEGVGQNLDGDVALQLRVARAIHLAHAACADLGHDFIDAEAGAGTEGQIVREYMAGRQHGPDYS